MTELSTGKKDCDHGFIVRAVKVNDQWHCKRCGEMIDVTEAMPIRIEKVDD